MITVSVMRKGNIHDNRSDHQRHFNWSPVLQSFYLITMPVLATILYLTPVITSITMRGNDASFFKLSVKLLCLCGWVWMRERNRVKIKRQGKEINRKCDNVTVYSRQVFPKIHLLYFSGPLGCCNDAPRPLKTPHNILSSSHILF